MKPSSPKQAKNHLHACTYSFALIKGGRIAQCLAYLPTDPSLIFQHSQKNLRAKIVAVAEVNLWLIGK